MSNLESPSKSPITTDGNASPGASAAIRATRTGCHVLTGNGEKPGRLSRSVSTIETGKRTTYWLSRTSIEGCVVVESTTIRGPNLICASGASEDCGASAWEGDDELAATLVFPSGSPAFSHATERTNGDQAKRARGIRRLSSEISICKEEFGHGQTGLTIYVRASLHPQKMCGPYRDPDSKSSTHFRSGHGSHQSLNLESILGCPDM